MLDEDTIILSRTTFSKIETVPGNILQEFEVVNSNSAASNSNAFIVYNQNNGNLYYNQNGSNNGFGSGGLFARLETAPQLQATDFFIDN